MKWNYLTSLVISSSVCLFEFLRSFLKKKNKILLEGVCICWAIWRPCNSLLQSHDLFLWTLMTVHLNPWIYVSGLFNCTNMSSNLIWKFTGVFMNYFHALPSSVAVCLCCWFWVAVQTSVINNPQSLSLSCHCGQFTWVCSAFRNSISHLLYTSPFTNFILVWGASEVMWGEAEGGSGVFFSLRYASHF